MPPKKNTKKAPDESSDLREESSRREASKRRSDSKVERSDSKPKFIIFKNINPIKLIYEHLLAETTLNPEEIITINENDDPQYVDHIIQDVPSTINDILKESSMDYTLFVDIRKNNIKSWPILISTTDNSKRTDDTTTLFNKQSFDYNKPTKIKCWWCKNSFDSLPLGIPLKRIGNKIFMEGVVCSFPCGKTYIKNIDGYDIKYKDSLSIFNNLYDEFTKINERRKSPSLLSERCESLSLSEGKKTNSETKSIPDAPHWNQLKEYGGHLSIDEFRSTFGKIKYTKTTNILLVSYPILFNEKIIDSGKK